MLMIIGTGLLRNRLCSTDAGIQYCRGKHELQITEPPEEALEERGTGRGSKVNGSRSIAGDYYSRLRPHYSTEEDLYSFHRLRLLGLFMCSVFVIAKHCKQVHC